MDRSLVIDCRPTENPVSTVPLAPGLYMPFIPFNRLPKLAATAIVIIPIAFALHFQVNSMTHSRALLSDENAAQVTNLKGVPVAVFVGGTSGIGQGLAEAFARWRKGNAHIIILGRNEAAAKEVIGRFPKPTTTTNSWTHEFVQCDVTLMKNVHSASEQILAKHSKINYLVMSPGYFAASGRDETSEGIDKKLAVHYYARWKFIDELLPALKKAKDDGEDVRVLSVFSAGHGGKIDPNDLGLKKGYSLKAAADSATTYNDLMIEVRFSQRLVERFASDHIILSSLLLIGVPRTKPGNHLRPCIPWRGNHQSHELRSYTMDASYCTYRQYSRQALCYYPRPMRRLPVVRSSQ